MKAFFAGIALCLGTLAANATLIEFNFAAKTSSDLKAGVGPWLQDVAAGTVGTGSFVLDTSVPNVLVNPVIGLFPEALVSANFSLGGMTFTDSGGVASTLLAGAATQVLLRSSAASATGIDGAWNNGGLLWSLLWILSADYPVFSTNDLPENINVADFSQKDFLLRLTQGQSIVDTLLELTSIERVEANTVPEPASLALLAVGLLGLAGLRKRQAVVR